MPPATKTRSDFAGFIDGFQARNLASIEKSIALQLSEMQARIAIIKGFSLGDSKSTALLHNEMAILDEAFRAPEGNIVDRLVGVGSRMSAFLIKDTLLFKKSPLLLNHVKGFVRAFFEAAEASRNQRMIDAAITLVKDYREIEESLVSTPV